MPAAGAKLFALCFGLCYICHTAAESASHRSAGITPAQSRKPADTLVIYIFAETDAESRNNLIFFLQHGVRPDDGAHYIVTVQADNATLVSYAQPVVKQPLSRACYA